MEIKVKSVDDVTREMEILFQEGSKRRLTLAVKEWIEGYGIMALNEEYNEPFYIKIGVPSDFIENRSEKRGKDRPRSWRMPTARQREAEMRAVDEELEQDIAEGEAIDPPEDDSL